MLCRDGFDQGGTRRSGQPAGTQGGSKHAGRMLEFLPGVLPRTIFRQPVMLYQIEGCAEDKKNQHRRRQHGRLQAASDPHRVFHPPIVSSDPLFQSLFSRSAWSIDS